MCLRLWFIPKPPFLLPTWPVHYTWSRFDPHWISTTLEEEAWASTSNRTYALESFKEGIYIPPQLGMFWHEVQLKASNCHCRLHVVSSLHLRGCVLSWPLLTKTLSPKQKLAHMHNFCSKASMRKWHTSLQNEMHTHVLEVFRLCKTMLIIKGTLQLTWKCQISYQWLLGLRSEST